MYNTVDAWNGQKETKGFKLEWLNQLQETIGDNEDLKPVIEAGMAEITAMKTANADLAKQAETWQKRFNEDVQRRDKALEENERLKSQLENAPKGSAEHQKQLDMLRGEYESKVSEYESKYKDIETKYYGSIMQSEFASLNLASKLPQGLPDEAISEKMDFFRYSLEKEGMTFDKETGKTVFVRDGVVRVNPDTGKPYTMQEMAGVKMKTSWLSDVSVSPSPKGAGRGDAGGGGQVVKTTTRQAFDGMSQGQRHEFIKSGGKVTE